MLTSRKPGPEKVNITKDILITNLNKSEIQYIYCKKVLVYLLEKNK